MSEIEEFRDFVSRYKSQDILLPYFLSFKFNIIMTAEGTEQPSR